MRKSIHKLLIAAILGILFQGCEKKEKTYTPTAQELRLNLHSEPPTLDPRKAIDSVSLSILCLCFEGLTSKDANGKTIPGIAENFSISKDKKIYTFFLRKAEWSDGHPVTAYDFESTWKTMLDPLFPCEFASDLYIIKNARAAKSKLCSLDQVGVKALNDQTLELELDHPVPYLLDALSTHIFFPTPVHITSSYPQWTKTHYISNGPFELKEWKHHDTLVLEKNPKYWDQKNTRLEKVSFAFIEDETTELSMYENGELDWAGYPFSSLPTEALQPLEKKGILHTASVSGTYYYIFNTQKFPFNNANIRRAFSLAINRQSLIANVTQMGQIPAMGLIPPTIWRDAGPHFKDHDLSEARKFFQLGLKELEITAKELPPISLSYNTYVGHHKIAQAIQEQWHQAFGIHVQLENKEWKVFLDELKHRQFQIARMGGLANINDPITFLDYYRYLSNSNNLPQWSDLRFTELLDEADFTDEPQRTLLLREAEKIFINAMPIAPIYFYTGRYLKKPYVKGIQLSELSYLNLKWAYVEIDDRLSR